MTKSCEVSWFSALCDDDYEFLGVPDPMLASSWEHCRNIVLQAEKGGFDSILLPSGYALGIDTTAFAAAIAVLTRRIRLLMAVRIGEAWPPQLARQIATLDRIGAPAWWICCWTIRGTAIIWATSGRATSSPRSPMTVRHGQTGSERGWQSGSIPAPGTGSPRSS